MVRFAAIFCFLVTLLCPVFCLADADAACADHGATAGQNCEAMAVGAVTADPVTIAAPLLWAVPDLTLSISGTSPALAASGQPMPADWKRPDPQPPPALRRQALLQTFLF